MFWLWSVVIKVKTGSIRLHGSWSSSYCQLAAKLIRTCYMYHKRTEILGLHGQAHYILSFCFVVVVVCFRCHYIFREILNQDILCARNHFGVRNNNNKNATNRSINNFTMRNANKKLLPEKKWSRRTRRESFLATSSSHPYIHIFSWALWIEPLQCICVSKIHLNFLSFYEHTHRLCVCVQHNIVKYMRAGEHTHTYTRVRNVWTRT